LPLMVKVEGITGPPNSGRVGLEAPARLGGGKAPGVVKAEAQGAVGDARAEKGGGPTSQAGIPAGDRGGSK
jgi:hypothetical protein